MFNLIVALFWPRWFAPLRLSFLVHVSIFHSFAGWMASGLYMRSFSADFTLSNARVFRPGTGPGTRRLAESAVQAKMKNLSFASERTGSEYECCSPVLA